MKNVDIFSDISLNDTSEIRKKIILLVDNYAKTDFSVEEEKKQKRANAMIWACVSS